MAIVSGNLATAAISATPTPTAAGQSTITVNAGTTQYPLWSDTLQVNTRAVTLKTANFEFIGSAPANALANMNLLIDGVDTPGTGTVISIGGTNYINFDLSSAPVTLTTGSHTLQVNADIVNGSSRTVQLILQQASDLQLTDPQVGVNIAVNFGSYSTTAAIITIGAGQSTLNQDPAFTSVNNVSGGAANTTIGQFTLYPYGENLKVTTLPVVVNFAPQSTTFNGGSVTLTGSTTAQTVAVASSTGFNVGNTISIGGTTEGTITAVGTGTLTAVVPTTVAVTNSSTVAVVNMGLNNVTLYFNGSQIGSQVTCSTANSNLSGNVCTINFQLGSQMIATAGQSNQIQVRADLQGPGSVSYTGGSIYVTIGGTNTQAQGQSSQQSATLAAITGNTLTLTQGTLAISANSNYLSQAQPLNTAGVIIGSYVVQNQSTAESVRLTNLQVGTTVTSGATIATITSLGTSDATAAQKSIQPSGVSTGLTSTDNFSVNDTLAPGASMTINILSNIGSLATGTSGTVVTTLKVTSIGVVDNITTTPTTGVTGQTITLGNGSVTSAPTVVASATTPVQYIATSVPSGSSNSAQVAYNFVSSSGASTINELRFTVSDNSSNNSITKVCVGTVCAQPVGGVADLTGLSLAVPNGGGGYTANVQLSFSGVGTGGLLPLTTSNVALTWVKYISGGSTVTLTNGTSSCSASTPACLGTSGVAAFTGSGMSLVGSSPTVAITQTTPATGLIPGSSGAQLVGQVTVTANASGAIRVGKIVFNVGNSGFNGATSDQQESLTNTYLANGTTKMTYSSCTSNGYVAGVVTSSVTCEFGSGAFAATNYSSSPSYTGSMGYQYDWPIGAGQSQVFNLYATVGGAAATSSVANVSTSLASDTISNSTTSYQTSNFVWDDSSMNGINGTNTAYGATQNGTGLNSTLIYNFPTNAYTIHQ
jgi:hypothetical protein